MLPIFPEFKKLELSDRADVERVTSQYPPYSDFNFVSMWSWDIQQEMVISLLHGNLVVKFNDYVTGDPFYSFFGTNQVNDTAVQLIGLTVSQGLRPELQLIPEISAGLLDTSIFNINPAREHFDYVYSLEELILLKGVKFQAKRGFLHRFLRLYPNYEIKKIDLSDREVQKEIFELNHIWTHNKLTSGKNPKSSGENLALERFFLDGKEFNLIAYGLFINGQMVGFTIDELIVDSEYVISHFIKGDINVVGVYMFLMHHSCVDFFESGKKYFNYEQDLGLPGLRKAKETLRPSMYLKKYRVSLH